MLVAANLKLAVDCPQCKLAVPVNGIAGATRCDHCSSNVPLRWKKLLDLGNPKINALDRAIALGPSGLDKGAFASIHLEVRGVEPACRSCQAPLPLSDMLAIAQAGRPVHCPSCGAEIPLRAAPRELIDAYPFARAVAYEAPLSENAGADDGSSAQPMMFQCMACGAALQLDGRDRTVTCQYCRGANYLPDGVWLRLHPPKKRKEFTVLSDVPEGHVWAQRYRFDEGGSRKFKQEAARVDIPVAQLAGLAHGRSEEVQRIILANPQCTTEVLMALAQSEYRKVRDGVAKHPAVTPAVMAAMSAAMEQAVLGEGADHDVREMRDIAADPRATPATLAALAKSRNTEARAALAENPSTPLEIAIPLQSDRHASVRAGLARRPGLPVDVIAALARDESDEVRAAIAARPDLRPEGFAALVRDTNKDVLRALVANPSATADALALIAKSDDEDLRDAAKKHPHYARKWWEVF